MSLNIKGPNITIKKSINSNFVVTGRQTYPEGVTDLDAARYLFAVEAADGQVLELSVKNAINSFVLGCKSDGIWDAIKASCILAGARTLNGALVPLKGTAPTNFNFVAGDYNRKTGLVGNGSSKYLDSNRNNNADPQDNNHLSIFISTAPQQSGDQLHIGANYNLSGTRGIGYSFGVGGLYFRSSSTTYQSPLNAGLTTKFVGLSRNNGTQYIQRFNSNSFTISQNSSAPTNEKIGIYRYLSAPLPAYSTARLAFYSIGEALDLALLDARVTTLMNAFAALP